MPNNSTRLMIILGLITMISIKSVPAQFLVQPLSHITHDAYDVSYDAFTNEWRLIYTEFPSGLYFMLQRAPLLHSTIACATV